MGYISRIAACSLAFLVAANAWAQTPPSFGYDLLSDAEKQDGFTTIQHSRYADIVFAIKDSIFKLCTQNAGKPRQFMAPVRMSLNLTVAVNQSISYNTRMRVFQDMTREAENRFQEAVTSVARTDTPNLEQISLYLEDIFARDEQQILARTQIYGGAQLMDTVTVVSGCPKVDNYKEFRRFGNPLSLATAPTANL